jgi:diadenosine tetraphosphatase ApaH/serine/threonine PP2A family protein phosphatase
MGRKKPASIEWTRLQLGDDRVAILAGLPFQERIEPPGGALCVVHANPVDLDRHIFPDMSDDEARNLIGEFEADILVFGHLHIPFRRRLGSLRLFNVASVGLPRDGDRRAVWGSFGWSPKSGWRGAIHRVPYDHGTTALRMIESGMPHAERRVRDLLKATYD